MEKAWEYFKTEKDVFLAVANNLPNGERVLLKKRFGKDFDGINVKSSIKKNELNDFYLICKKVKIEIDFAEKVKNNGKIMSNYLNDKNYDFLNKIMYAYNINKNALDDIINSLAKGERIAFLYYFGIDRKKMSISAIADLLNNDEIYVYTNINSALETIKRKSYRRVEVKSAVIKSQTNQVPINIMNPLIKKGYTQFEIINAIKEYDENIVSILKKLYGNSFNNTRSLMIKVSPEDAEIVLNILNGDDNIESKIIKAREAKTKKPKDTKGDGIPTYFKGNLQTYYQKRNYTKKEFIDAFRELSLEEKQKLFMCFDHSFNSLDVSELPKKDVDFAYAIAFSSRIGIQYQLINNRQEKNKKEDSNTLYKILCKKENSKRLVDAVINALDTDSKNALYQYFDNEGNIIKSYDNDPLIKNLLFITIPTYIKKYDEVDELLNKFNDGIYHFFGKHKKIYVDIAISDLIEKEREIYDNYFDENGMLKHNPEYKVEIINIINKTLPEKINEAFKTDYMSDDLSEYLSKFAIDKKHIEIVLNSLSHTDKKLLNTYYSENLTRKSEANFNVTIYTLLNKLICQLKQFNLCSYYKNVSKDDLKELIAELSPNDKVTFYKYFDEEGNLTNTFNANDNPEIYRIITEKIKNKRKARKGTNIYERSKNHGYERNIVDIAIETLNETQKENFFNEYDKNGNKIGNSKNMSVFISTTFYNRLQAILDFMNNTAALIKYFNQYEISSEELSEYINLLNPEIKDKIYYYYDKSLIRKQNVYFDINTYNFLNHLIDNVLSLSKEKTVNNKLHKRTGKGLNIYEKCKNHGYERNIVDIAIETLNETQKENFFNEYDKNGNKIGSSKGMTVFISTTFYKKLDNILKFMNDTNSLIEYFEHQGIEKDEFLKFISLLDYQMTEKIKYYYDDNLIRKEGIVFNIDAYNFLNHLTNEIVSFKNKQHKYNFYKSWESKGYNRICIDIAISLLPNEAKKAFREAYDENGYRIKSLKECLDGSASSYSYLYAIIKRNLNNISNFINETVSLYDYFAKMRYTNREVDYIIASLDKNDRHYLDSYYDNNLVRDPDKEVSAELYKLLNKIEGSFRKVNLYTKYEFLGYSRDDVTQVISKLTHLEQLMLYKYFDKNLNVIKDYSGAPRVMNLINVVIVEYMKKNKNDAIISEEKDEQKNLSLFEEYINSIKKLNVFSKEFISSLSMSNEEKYYLTIEFVFNEQSTFKSKDIAKFLNLEYKEYISKVYQAMMKARNELSTKFDNSLESIKKVLD